MSNNPLIYIDTETTGLDVNSPAQAYEVAWAIDSGPIERLILPHDWRDGDPYALTIGGYMERKIFDAPVAGYNEIRDFYEALIDGTLVGSNPSFDAGFLMKMFRETVGLTDHPWHHRLINVSDVAMTVFDWDRPKGLADVQKTISLLNYKIPKPDHTAAGDVDATRATYIALRDIRRSIGEVR